MELEMPLMLDELEVIPMIDNKPLANAELIGDALPVISLKDLADDGHPDGVVKRNSYRNLHRPNISHLDWVSQSSSKEETVIEKVRSYHSHHSARLSLEHSAFDISSHGSRDGSGIGSGSWLQHYAPAGEPIKEESREVLTRTSTLADVINEQQQQPTEVEFVIRQQTLGELSAMPDTVASTTTTTEVTTDEQPTKLDEEQHSTGQIHPGSHPTVTTQFSRQFEFGDVAEGGRDLQEEEEIQAGLHSAWSQDAMKHQDSRADHVLVETTRQLSVAEQDRRSDVGEFEWGAAELTRDAFQVAIQRVSAPKPVPLSPGVISAAEFITLDILHRALRDDLKAALKCGPDQIKLSSALVRRVLASASSTKWSEAAVKAASLLVDDVLSTALQYASPDDGEVVAESDHVWSRDAIQVCCLIVRDLMGDAARQVSTALAKQQATIPAQQQPPTADRHSQQDLVDVEFDADRHDILKPVPPHASQTVKPPVIARDSTDSQSQKAAPRGPDRARDTQDITKHKQPRPESRALADRPGQKHSATVEGHAAKLDTTEAQPAPALTTTSRPPSEIPSACSIFSDSTNPSEFRLTF